uniref:F-box domain-containing protein n=1 Tax=Davidia involucrata TaxID=16924 RepID=A0A5B7BXG8_DAVIN
MNFQEEEDQFDRLPDALVRLIFNKVRDAKSLCRCKSVSKRFASIIPEIDTVFLTITRRNPIPINDDHVKESADRNSKSSSHGLPPRNFLKSLINKLITKPLRFILHVISPKSSSSSRFSEDENELSYHSPNEVLKNFNEIQSLQIELPAHGGEIGSNGGDSLLKWKAEFGSELKSCLILGATSFHRDNNGEQRLEQEHEQFTDDDLKLRVVWTLSCLIAASARHYFLQQVVSDHHEMLRSVVVTDASKQGRLCMREEQIEELRSSSAKLESSERSRVPALKMKLWYVPVLELPASGCVMKGATLVVIRPVDGPPATIKSDNDDLLRGAFDGEEEDKALGEAVREMMKKKNTYTLEMNSF